MKKSPIVAALVAASSLLAVEGVSAKQQCYQRQERVCSTVGRGHDGRPRVICSYRTVQQCFQVPEVRNEKLRFPRSRRR